MAASTFIHHNPFPPRRPSLLTRKSISRIPIIRSSLTPQLGFSDPLVLQLAETLEDSLPNSTSSALQKIRDSSSQTLLSTPWPTRRDEPFRFTDTSFIKNLDIYPTNSQPPESLNSLLLEEVDLDLPSPILTFVDGHIVDSLSNLVDLPDGVYVGSLLNAPSESSIVNRVNGLIRDEFDSGDLFWSINGVGAPDLTIVYVPPGCVVENPLYLRYISVEGSDEGSGKLPISNPRVFVLVEEGGEIGVIEEFCSGNGSKCYWANPVLEVVIEEGGIFRHSYLQNQSPRAAHIKWTSVRQESSSKYELTEVSMGGRLSRHNLHIQQLGPDTETQLSTLHLSVTENTQDLHSSLVLDHPRGRSNQLHKCIVAHSKGQAVFDGNVKVNRFAQQTDARQLTRSLLLEPRATVNVKPNLQIIADDVKCSHGAAISDLEEGQLFYLQARGIDRDTARKALVFSFGAQVVSQLPHPTIRKRVETQIKGLLLLGSTLPPK